MNHKKTITIESEARTSVLSLRWRGALTTLLAIIGINCFAEITISDVRIFSGYPWKEIMIGYHISGNTGDGKVLQINAKDNLTGNNYSFSSQKEEDLINGSHVLKWNASANGAKFRSSNVDFTLQVQPMPTLYCVLDFSEIKWKVSYLNKVPNGGWTDEYKTDKMVLRRIEPGTFQMGDRKATYPNVTISKPYYIGAFEVTQRQWQHVKGTNPSYFGDSANSAMLPVERVSYNMIRGDSFGSEWPETDAVDENSFLGKLRANTGMKFDLPTEAQWEYACRAETTTDYNNGTNYSNPTSDSNMAKVGRYYYGGGANTANVGSYIPNKWGLYDMHGNVREWCLDWYGTRTSDVKDPCGVLYGSFRVLRSGSFACEASECRSAARDYGAPSEAKKDIGFRIVLIISE